MIRMLPENEVDIIAASLDMTLERSEALDYIWPMVEIADVVVIR